MSRIGPVSFQLVRSSLSDIVVEDPDWKLKGGGFEPYKGKYCT